MTDKNKWKSVMIRVDTYNLLKEIADRDSRAMASIVDQLIVKEWEWHFGKKTGRLSQTDTIEKAPERSINPRNPFLPRKG
jgi:hypothetical protein